MRREAPSPADLQRTLEELDAVLSKIAELLQEHRRAAAGAPLPTHAARPLVRVLP